jgi:hypothetical protein
MELRSRSDRSLQRPGSAPIAVWFIIINLHRQAPGQARWASLSAERSAGTVFSSCSRRTINIRNTYLFPFSNLTLS